MENTGSDKLSQERTELAEERTRLAEERTQLAYIRTGFSIILAGIFLLGFFEERFHYATLAYIIIFIGLIFLAYGFYTHQKSRSIVRNIIKKFKNK